MRSEPERWASMRSAASRAAAAQPSEAERREAMQADLKAGEAELGHLTRQVLGRPPRTEPPQTRKMAGHAKLKVFLVILVILVGWGIISSFDKDPVKSFLLLLVFAGGPACFMLVLARYPETRLGKLFEKILVFLAMFGSGGGRG
jgi:hypothetical protein